MEIHDYLALVSTNGVFLVRPYVLYVLNLDDKIRIIRIG